MLRTRNGQPTLWEAILPQELLELPELLAKVDALLDDEAFFAPFRDHFHPTEGRPSIPMETYLRLMFLKHRYRLGYETLCREVAVSLTWRRFCRIPLGTSVPHPTTLMKIISRCGDAAVTQLNDALLAQAAEAKLVRLDKVRVDTTVEADVAYPTDSGLPAVVVVQIPDPATSPTNRGYERLLSIFSPHRTTWRHQPLSEGCGNPADVPSGGCRRSDDRLFAAWLHGVRPS